MPTYALLGADLYLPPTLCTWGGGGGPETTGKTSKPELPVPSAMSGAQLATVETRKQAKKFV
jgi:hypothetical protein